MDVGRVRHWSYPNLIAAGLTDQTINVSIVALYNNTAFEQHINGPHDILRRRMCTQMGLRNTSNTIRPYALSGSMFAACGETRTTKNAPVADRVIKVWSLGIGATTMCAYTHGFHTIAAASTQQNMLFVTVGGAVGHPVLRILSCGDTTIQWSRQTLAMLPEGRRWGGIAAAANQPVCVFPGENDGGLVFYDYGIAECTSVVQGAPTGCCGHMVQPDGRIAHALGPCSIVVFDARGRGVNHHHPCSIHTQETDTVMAYHGDHTIIIRRNNSVQEVDTRAFGTAVRVLTIDGGDSYETRPRQTTWSSVLGVFNHRRHLSPPFIITLNPLTLLPIS